MNVQKIGYLAEGGEEIVVENERTDKKQNSNNIELGTFAYSVVFI